MNWMKKNLNLLKCAVDRVICVKTEAMRRCIDVEDPRAMRYC